MSGKKRRRAERAARSSQTGPASATGQPTSGWRLLSLAGVAVGATALVIIIAVMLTPHDEVVQPPDAQASGAQGDEPVVSRPLRSELVLPQNAETLDVELLQQELIGHAKRLLELYPNDTGALFMAGVSYSALQQSEQAVELLRQCIKLSPKQTEAYVGLAKNLTLLGESGEAVEVLKLAVARGKTSAQVTKSLADALANHGQLDEAAHLLEAGAERYAEDSQVWLQLGQVLVELQRYEQAESSIRTAMQLGERGVPSLVALSTSLTRQGKREQAMQVRKQLAELSAQKAPRAKTAASQFQTEFEELLRRNAVQVLYAGAKVYEQHSEWQNAETLLLRSITLDPQHIPSYQLLTMVYRSAGRLPDVTVVLQRLIDLQPDTIQHYTNLASVAAQFGDHALAERVLRLAMARNLEGGTAHWTLGVLCLSQGRAAEALEFAQVAAERMQNIDAYLLLVSAYQAVGNNAAARQAYQKAKQLDPDDPRLRAVRI